MVIRAQLAEFIQGACSAENLRKEIVVFREEIERMLAENEFFRRDLETSEVSKDLETSEV